MKEPKVVHFMQENGYKAVDKLFVGISYGKITPHQLLAQVLSKEELEVVEKEEPRLKKLISKIPRKTHGLVKVGGLSDVLITFGQCCSPVPGDGIAGFVTRGKGVSIHVNDCPKLLATDPDRRVSVEWDTSIPISRVARLKVVCIDRPGLLSGMTDAITHQGVNIAQATIRTSEDQKAINVFDVVITNVTQLRQVMKSLEKVKGVISVERMRSQ